MSLDYATLDLLRQSHPAWRLLRSDHAPLVANFLQRVFISPNVRVMAQADLAEALENELFALRERLGAEAFPKSALEYLNDWTNTEKGWLRKFYVQGSDEAHFDLTPATEKAIAWLGTTQPGHLRCGIWFRDVEQGRMAFALPRPLLGRHRHPRLRDS